MKKRYLLHILYLVSFFLLISVLREWFGLVFIEFWVGGIVGTFLPDIDRILYVYVIGPDTAVAKQVSGMVEQKKSTEKITALSSANIDKKDLIFHSARFQLIFLLFAFWIISSSNSLFGWGLALAFTLHLLVDQAIDLMRGDDLSTWFRDVPFEIDADQRKLFFGVNLVILLFLGLIY